MLFLKKYLWLIFILVVGVAFRFYDLANVPPGLWYDEAFYADKAMDFLNGNFSLIYYQRDESQIGLFPGLLALGFLVFGDTIIAPRVVMAVWGCLGLAGCYVLSIELFRGHQRKKGIALLATFLLATSYWHVNFSRLIFSASLVPTVEVFSVLLTILAFRLQKFFIAGLAGLITAAGFYTYWQYYPFAILPALIVLAHLWRSPAKHIKIVCVYGIMFCLALAPLLHAFFTHDMLARLRLVLGTPGAQQSTLDTVSAALLQFACHTSLHIKMLFFDGYGDRNWRHNLSGQAELSPLASFGVCAALCSLLLLLKNRYRRGIAYMPAAQHVYVPLLILFAWTFFAMLAASLSNEGLPHASRAIGMVIPLQIIAAFGLYSAGAYGQSKLKLKLPERLSHHVGIAVMAVLMLNQTIATARQYFIVFANAPEAKSAFSLLDQNFLRHNFARQARQ